MESVEGSKGQIRTLSSVIEEYERRLAEKDRENVALLMANEKLFQEKKAAEELAREDTLTGLPNRRAYEERFVEIMANAKRTGRPFCLMAIDIDDFKQLNDKEGHQAGDAALRSMARIVKGNIRVGDVIARTGGEEFFLILPDTNLDEANIVAEKLLGAFREQGTEWGHSPFTISGGISQFDEGDKNLNSRLGMEQFADAGLYQAKAIGKNRVFVHSSERVIEKRAIIEQAKKLIKRNTPKELSLEDRRRLFEEMAKEAEMESQSVEADAEAKG